MAAATARPTARKAAYPPLVPRVHRMPRGESHAFSTCARMNATGIPRIGKVKYGSRSPKFIWAPCHVMCTAVLIG